MADLVGQNLGPYRILEQIGLGGMATVYKAYHAAMDRYVAIKVLPQHLARDPNFRARFQREARAIARLEHLYILPVYDAGEDEGIPYLVMRYTDSGDLSDLIARQSLTIARAVQLISQVAAGLAYAHRLGVIHRDVKPANVLLSRAGDVLLTDFGIAKIYEETLQLTSEGTMVGTPAYMAPEQVQGQPVDARTDIYALGVVLYQALTGECPFMADTPLALALMHIHNPLRPPRQLNPNIPESLERIMLRALAKSPADRFQTADEMAEALHNALADLSRPTAVVAAPAAPTPPIQPPPTPAPAAPTARDGRPRGWLAAGAVAAAVGLLALFLVFPPGPSDSSHSGAPGAPPGASVTGATPAPTAVLAAGGGVTGATASSTVQPTAAPAAQPTAAPTPTTAPTATIAPAAGADTGKVFILGAFTGSEEAAFNDVIKVFEEANPDIDVTYTGSSDFDTLIQARVQAGDAPDIVGFSQPGGAARLAREGNLVTLWPEALALIDKNYAPVWKELGSVDDTPYGMFHRVNAKGFIWYNKTQFEKAGYTVPKTWKELTAMTEKMKTSGIAPWCDGIESGAATGWKGTDWIENIMLRTQPTDKYDQWVAGQLAFTSPEVKNAFEILGKIWTDPQAVYGGQQTIAQTKFDQAAAWLFDNPPKCWLHMQGGFVTNFFPDAVKQNLDQRVGVFVMPPIDPKVTPALEIGGDEYVVFKGRDRPEVKKFIEFLGTVEATTPWARQGGALFPHKGQDFSVYRTQIERIMAETIVNAQAARFDGSDTMTGELNQAFWKGITDWVSGNRDLDGALQDIDRARK